MTDCDLETSVPDWIIEQPEALAAIPVAALLLLAGAVGLVVWMSSGPSVYSSGHRWALDPSTGGSPEPDSSSEQEKLAFDGNVKAFTLIYTEHLTNGEGEKIISKLMPLAMRPRT